MSTATLRQVRPGRVLTSPADLREHLLPLARLYADADAAAALTDAAVDTAQRAARGRMPRTAVVVGHLVRTGRLHLRTVDGCPRSTEAGSGCAERLDQAEARVCHDVIGLSEAATAAAMWTSVAAVRELLAQSGRGGTA
jgi:hypothetical protein